MEGIAAGRELSKKTETNIEGEMHGETCRQTKKKKNAFFLSLVMEAVGQRQISIDFDAQKSQFTQKNCNELIALCSNAI